MSGKLREVLLVEDDEQMACVITALLSMELNRILTVRTLAEALIAVESKKFDLVLLDLGLPDSPVESTMAAIPEFKRTGCLVVVVTGSTISTELRDHIAKAGADELIGKTDPDFLVSLRRTVCGSSFI